MSDANDRRRALETIAALAREHGLSADEIAAAIGASQSAPAPGPRERGRLVRVLGYLGGTFVFAGIGVFVALQWAWMNAGARVVATLGSGLAALVLALLAYADDRFDKAAAPLLLIAALLEPIGMLVAFQEFGSGGDWRIAALITFGAMALQFGATFSRLRRSTPLFVTVVFAALFWWTALDLLDAEGRTMAMAIGASLLLAAAGVDRTAHRDITPVWYLIGAAAFLTGFFDLVQRTPLELAFLAAAAAFVYFSVVARSRTLLFVATIAILAYTTWFTREHFADSIGWPLALIIFGFLMFGLSALAFRLDRRYLRARTAP